MRLPVPAFVPEEFAHPNPRMILPMLPVIAFTTASRTTTTEVAILISFLASAMVFAACRESGIIRFLAIQSFITVSGAAIVGIALSNEKVFVAENIVGDGMVVIIAMASLVIGRPFYGLIIRESIPRVCPALAASHQAFVQLTLLFVALQLATGVGRIFLLQELSAADYAVVSRVITWPLTALFLMAVYLLVTRALEAHRLAEQRWQPALPAG